MDYTNYGSSNSILILNQLKNNYSQLHIVRGLLCLYEWVVHLCAIISSCYIIGSHSSISVMFFWGILQNWDFKNKFAYYVIFHVWNCQKIQNFGSKNKYQKNICLEKTKLYASIHDKCCRFNDQHNWGDLYDHLMSMGIFTLIIVVARWSCIQ